MNKRTKDAIVSGVVGMGIVFLLVPGTFWVIRSQFIGSAADKTKAKNAATALKDASEA
tara:strand:+ start:953 stop:1126 length:174 start_codon:yes stop_codon:yes gene_type:complete